MSNYLRVLRHQNFRYLFLGQAASAIGDQVVIVALALFITRRTGSATDLGVVLAAQALPMVVLMLFGGVWADRLPRHRIMIACDAVRAALHALLAVLIFTGAVEIWQLVVIEALFGAARAFFQPAYTGLIPQTVPEGLIQDAQALTESVANVSIMVGPALSAALVLGVGAGEAFMLDALTFVVSALLLLRVKPRARGTEVVASESVLHALRGGWREVRSRSWVWATIVVFSGAILVLYAPWYALAPLIARDSYNGAGLFGVLESVAGAGAVVGALIGIRWRPERPLRTGLLLAFAWPVEGAVFAAGAPLALVVAFSFATGFGFSLLMIWWETALAQHIPPHALSRVSSYDWAGSLALMPLGFALAGPLASAFGAQTVLGVGSAVAFVLLALALVPRSTRELGSAEQRAGEVDVEARGVAEVAHVDTFVGVMHQRRNVEQVHVPVREEAVRGAVRKRLAEPARVGEAGEQHGDGPGSRVIR
jgi:MFS family permease